MTEPVSWPTVKRPLIAILRGIRPDEAESIVGTLIDSGFELIEVPLNSPEALRLDRVFRDGVPTMAAAREAPDPVSTNL